MTSPLRNDGKELERLIGAALRRFQTETLSLAHRFPDTRAAGGSPLGKQPGDFLWLIDGRAILIEAKSTDCGKTLLQLIKGSKNAKEQVAQHRMWLRAKQPAIYWWADLESGRSLIYPSTVVVDGMAMAAPWQDLVRGRQILAALVGDEYETLKLLRKSLNEDPTCYL